MKLKSSGLFVPSLFLVLPFLFLSLLTPLTSARAEKALPVHAFLGSDLGWGTVSPYAPPEGTRNGMDFDLKALGSVYFKKKWIFDLGGGWSWAERTGENTNRGFSKTITKGAFLETSLRYGSWTGWQFGPVLKSIQVADVGLGNGQLIDSEAQKALLGGVQVYYEWPQAAYRMRVGARVMTDLNIDYRTVNVIQVGFEIGLPVMNDRQTTRYAPRPGIQVVQKDRALKRVRMILDARRIEFDFDQATLRPEAVARLSRLGKFLAKSHDNWEFMRITGHTDERGTVEYNQRLSENRAAAVKNALFLEGVAREKVDSKGYSELQPLDTDHTELAWQKNRRVEFEFTGVQDLELIIDGVNQATDDEEDDSGNGL